MVRRKGTRSFREIDAAVPRRDLYAGGEKLFAFGGGESADAMLREENHFWWPEEQPTPEEEEYAFKKLEQWGNKVDYIITHDAPISICEFLNLPPIDVNSRINNMLEKVGKTVTFKRWFLENFIRIR